jgi:Tol biopolymer transport system component
LQVVCYQLWENLAGQPGETITEQDLQASGDVDAALADFYEQALRETLARTDTTELALRRWFSEQLITEAGTRGTVFQGESETAGLPNQAVRILASQYLLRAEIRAGGTWYELAHDRFVPPIPDSNYEWRLKQPLIQQAQKWADVGRSQDKLLEGNQLEDALATNWQALGPLVAEYMDASQVAQEARDARMAAEQEAQRQRELEAAEKLAAEQQQRAIEQAQAATRLRGRALLLAAVGVVAVLLAIAVGLFGVQASQHAELAQIAQAAAEQQAATAEARRIEAAKAKAEAETAAARAEAEQMAAVTAQAREAEAAATAVAQATAANGARETLAANLAAQIAAASATPTPLAPTPVPSTASVPSSPQPPLSTPIPTPNQGATATAVALQTVAAQLTQVRAEQTAAAPTSTPTATPILAPAQVNFPPPGRIVFASNRFSHIDLYSMDGGGGDPRRLTSSLGVEASYSPATDKIAFSRPRIGDIVSLYVMDPDGSGEISIDERFWDNWEPTFSPDGRRVAYVSSRENRGWEIYSMRIGESDINPVLLSCQNIPEDWKKWGPAWSPTDDRRIAFVAESEGATEFEGQTDIWLMDDDGTNCRQLTGGDVINKRPAWSPDGKQIAFISNRDGNFEIYVMDSDGRNLRRLTNTADEQENYPAWSLDGKWIAFSLPVGENQEIFVMTIDGQHRTNVTNNSAQDFAPVWLP